LKIQFKSLTNAAQINLELHALLV